MQSIYMLVLAGVCAVSGTSWLVQGQIGITIAFYGFMIGYLGLALVFK